MAAIYGIWAETADDGWWWKKTDGEIFNTEHFEVARVQLATIGKSYQGLCGEVKNSIRRIDEWGTWQTQEAYARWEHKGKAVCERGE